MLATEIDTHKDVVTLLASEHGIEPSVWIGKENLIPFVEESFPDCLILDKNKLVAGRQDGGGNLSLSALKELNSYWESVDFRDQRLNLLEEFNRYPALGNLRTLDREVLLRKLQIKVFSGIKDKSPDFLLALDVPHNPVNLSALYIAKWLKIPTLFFFGPGSLAPALIPSVELNHANGPRVLASSPKPGEESEAVDFILELVQSTLNRLAFDSKTHWQEHESERLSEVAPHRFQRLKDLKVGFRRGVHRYKDKSSAILADVIDETYESLSTAHESLPILEDYGDHGLFYLHFQPEASVIPFGFSDTFQGEAVAKARNALPQNLKLLVKEHPSQLNSSMDGGLGRSRHFYDFVNSLPETTAISAYSSSEGLSQTTRVVFTLTGSIGIEAAIKGIPIVHFGGAWWSGMPGTFHVEDVELVQKLETYVAPSFAEIADFLTDLIRASSIPGFADSGTKEYWEKVIQPPGDFEDILVQRLVSTIARFAREGEKHFDCPPRNAKKP